MSSTQLPKLPAAHDELAKYIAKNPSTPLSELMHPYREFEAQLREVYAQDRSNPMLDDPYLNILPLFTKDTPEIKTRARDLEKESDEEKSKYIMTLPEDKRRPHGSPAVVENLKEFRSNFSIFSESSLADMDWSNVVAAGSSVVNCILPVPAEFKKSKRALRQYYHEKFCPASDVDLFLYGLNEEEAIEKIKDIEARIRDAILSETTVVRTKNAITICSQYPTRHIQIVLRVYKNISEILTGFDIDCACAAYDGEQVYCVPRALASYISQINPIDLSRRSPSYENRLSKYSHRNFEVYWPELDRTRVDPTIYERSFQRTLGLARLLVLERLPTTNAREQYQRKRREERGRPQLDNRFQHRLFGNIKDNHEDEVADWVGEDDVSNYHTFTVPYGQRFNAKKIEKLCYTKDLLLNAEWNQQKDRTVYLHRHPAFFGRVIDVVTDCCGTCPAPVTTEEKEIAEKESEIYVSGKVSFRIDDPGRQQIGSFNPLTENDWTEMAYVGNTARLCQAIVDGDLEHVQDWLAQEGADPNTRDYTGRTPLHLAVISSTPEVVKCLVDGGARLVARLADGQTALHLAAARGNTEMVKILLEKSNANEEEEEDKLDQRRKTREAAEKDGDAEAPTTENDMEIDNEANDGDDSDAEMIDGDDVSDDGVKSAITGSFVKLEKDGDAEKKDDLARLDDDQNDPDFYKIDVVAWDSKCSALHLAILGGHCEVAKLLCQEFGADVLLPVKIGDGSYDNEYNGILTLALCLTLPVEKAVQMTETLLSLGATCSQADAQGVTAFHRFVKNGNPALIDTLYENDMAGLKTAIGHIAMSGSSWNPTASAPLNTAIQENNSILVLKLLDAGAKPEIDFDTWLKSAKFSFEKNLGNFESNQKNFRNGTDQPLIAAIQSENPSMALELLERGADPNVLTKGSYDLITNEWSRRYNKGYAAIDIARGSLHKLRKYRGEKSSFSGYDANGHQRNFNVTEPPQGPLETDSFLAQFKEGTYQYWNVSADITSRLLAHKKAVKDFEKEKSTKANPDQLKRKQEAIDDLISQLEKVVTALQAKGAKSFTEQYPDIEHKPDSVKATEDEEKKKQSPYKFNFDFQGIRDLTEARKAAYIELFEAAWRGDIDQIKKYTLTSWDGEDKEAPLQVAVRDNKNNNPFSLAFLRGHLEAAKAVLEIAQAQWTPGEEENTRYRMTRDEDEESYEDSEAESEDEPEVVKEVVIDKLTIDNIGQISMQVKSRVLPTDVMGWYCKVITTDDGKPNISDRTYDLLYYSILKGDMEQFKALLDLYTHFSSKQPQDDKNEDDDSSLKAFVLPSSCFAAALKHGRTDMLTEAIKRSGAGMPFDDLLKKSGTEIKKKPRYYQGLSVYGKKRADWANAGRNLVVKPTGRQASPLLDAALAGSLESVEWFTSDTPMRHYIEFGDSKAAKDHPSVKHLKAVEGRFDRAIAKWLGLQNDLVIHCAVLGPLGDKQNQIIEYLIKTYPTSLETKSNLGYTPLYLAFLLGRTQFAKTLIAAEADISVKDKQYNNLVHAALTNNPKDADQLRDLLNLLDGDMRNHLFCQRNGLAHGGDTPLHYWLQHANNLSYNYQYSHRYGNWQNELGGENEKNTNILKMMLGLSGAAELEILNSAGNTILHTAVLRQLPLQMAILIEANPRLLFRENAVGRTPAEIAYDGCIHDRASKQEPVVSYYNHDTNPADIVDKDLSHFAEKKDTASSKVSRKEQCWLVCEEQLAKHDAGFKRRLVSLNEANDVAIRIGESYTGYRYFQKSQPQPDDADAEEEDEETKRKREEEEEKNKADLSTISYNNVKNFAWQNAPTEVEEDEDEAHALADYQRQLQLLGM